MLGNQHLCVIQELHWAPLLQFRPFSRPNQSGWSSLRVWAPPLPTCFLHVGCWRPACTICSWGELEGLRILKSWPLLNDAYLDFEERVCGRCCLKFLECWYELLVDISAHEAVLLYTHPWSSFTPISCLKKIIATFAHTFPKKVIATPSPTFLP